MRKLTALLVDNVAPHSVYQAPREVTRVLSSRLVSPPAFSLWLCVSDVDDGAALRWAAPHGDDAVYVLEGALDVGDTPCPRGSVMIVESDAVAEARAVGPTSIAHFGPTDDAPPRDGQFGPPAAGGHRVHVVGPAGRFVSGQRHTAVATWFADSTCPTCRCALFLVEGFVERRGPTHHHSQDEIIYLTGGGIRMGSFRYGAGTSLCIPAGVRYAFTGAAQGHRFLNYRRDVARQTNDPTQPPILDTAMARGGSPTANGC